MAFARRYGRRNFGRTRRRHYRRRRVGTTRFPRRRNRYNQNLSTSSMWFKTCGDITANPANDTCYLRTNPNAVFPIPSFVNVCRGYEQYKVVRVVVKFYPAFVGSETTTAAPNGYRRGNVVTYIDQPPLNGQPSPGTIATLMGWPSAKLHQTRATIKRWMNRPSGGRYLDWAFITHPTALGLPVVAPDTWDSEIVLFGDDFSTSPQSSKPYFFVEAMFKVVFRSRYRGGAP